MLLASSTADYIDAIANLVGALAWPIAVVVVVAIFRDRIRAILEEFRKRVKAGEVTVKAGPIEISTVAKSAAHMGAAAVSRAASLATEDERLVIDINEAVDASASAVASFASHAGSWSTLVPRILWVDDTPQNNIYEIQAFEALGMTVVTRTSTQEALDLLETQSFDVIISNMGRPGDNQAGYTLLGHLRPHDPTPFIVYSSSNKPEHKQMARERGAVGATNNPTELLSLVQKALATTTGSTG